MLSICIGKLRIRHSKLLWKKNEQQEMIRSKQIMLGMITSRLHQQLSNSTQNQASESHFVLSIHKGALIDLSVDLLGIQRYPVFLLHRIALIHLIHIGKVK